MKAYRVGEDCEGSATIQFADHAIVARRNGANELNVDFRDVECRRAPQFDQYACGPVPVQALLNDGWWITCLNCYRHLEDHDDPKIIKGDAYCSQWCRLRFVERRGKDTADRMLAERIAKQKFPGAVSIYGHRTTDRNNSRKVVLAATIRFPGDKVGARWIIDNDTVEIAPIDMDAFNTWKASGYQTTTVA